MNSGIRTPHSLNLLALPVLALLDASVEEARKAARQKRLPVTKARRRGWQLQPGGDTPLWNELLRRVRTRMRRRGDQAQLARVLGLSRQRLNRCLTGQAALLDAERTLLLLGWLAARDEEREIGTPPTGVM